MLKFVIAGVALFGFATSAAATGLGLELDGARSNGRWGADLGAGYRYGFAGFDITPRAGVFLYKGDSNGYFTTNDSNGKHCRAPNGQFASKSKCDRVAAKGFAAIEAGFTIPMVARVGVGGRYVGSDFRPYGTASVALAPTLNLKANGGPHYAALGVTFGF